jgi:hypothetical protein
MVRALQFAAVRAFLKGFDLQRIMATTHAALGRRGFSLGDSHLGTCSISIKSSISAALEHIGDTGKQCQKRRPNTPKLRMSGG